MKPALIDKVLVIWIAAVLVVMTACLTILWSWALDSSGRSTLLAISATFWAVSAAAGVPSRLSRAGQRLAIWLKLQDTK